MSPLPVTKPLITKADIEQMAEAHLSHPFPSSDIHLKRPSQATGLRRLSLSIARVPPG